MIHDICDVAALYQHQQGKFLDKMESLRPRFDTALLSYLKFAIDEEISVIKSSGKDPQTMPSVWLQVLQVVRQGVFAEIESRYVSFCPHYKALYL